MLLASEIALLITSFILPITLAIAFGYVLKVGWKPVIWGAFCQIVTLLIIRMPILLVASNNDWIRENVLSNTVVYSLIVALITAGVSTLLCMAVLRFSYGQYLNLWAGLGFGLGYGMMESVLFSGINVLNVLLGYSEALSAADAGNIWLSAIERLCMLVIEMAFAVWICRGFMDHKKMNFWTAFLGFFAVIFVGTALTNAWDVPRIVTEIILIILAAVCIWWLWPQFFSKEAIEKTKQDL